MDEAARGKRNGDSEQGSGSRMRGQDDLLVRFTGFTALDTVPKLFKLDVLVLRRPDFFT